MNPTKLAVIGVGHHGRQHVRVFKTIEDVDLVAVVDVDEKRADKIAKEFKTNAETDYTALIDQVDAVSIAVPAQFHFEVSQFFLNRDKHVFLEKPIAETTEQAAGLIELSRDKEIVFQIGHIERFNPAISALNEVLGDARFIEAHRLCMYNPRGCDVGVVMDLMIHDIEIVLHLVKSPVKLISAVGINVLSPSEDIANARLEFENGCIANITTSRVSPENMRKIRVFQNDAYISLDYRKQEGLIYRKDSGKIIRESIPMEKSEPLKLELESFVKCVQESSTPLVTGEQGKRALEIAFDILHEIKKR
jgi:predicted dehydrogenase